MPPREAGQAMPCGGIWRGGWDPFATRQRDHPGRDTAGPPHPPPGVLIVRRSSVLVAIAVVAIAWPVLWSAGPARAAGAGVDLDQWASSDRAWQNGNLN